MTQRQPLIKYVLLCIKALAVEGEMPPLNEGLLLSDQPPPTQMCR